VDIETVGVIGSGTMGQGIAQVVAQAGIRVRVHDAELTRVDAAVRRIRGHLDRQVEKGKLSAEARDAAMGRIVVAEDVGALRDAQLVIEAVPEELGLKQALFGQLSDIVSADAILATNTSSLSVARIAGAAKDGARVIGMHFFNPVPIMALVELVVHPGTAPEVVVAARAFGAAVGKECILVKDSPGFATSRLGVCLGMEAIRMLEQGVASAEDIDKAMVLGYRHPVGPLKLTDMVGLDVRMAIGSYLAVALDNPAFEPPVLMRTMVAAGELGQKAGRGFYEWTAEGAKKRQ
jgi:3-hydroxybutyryl-CoA dehydrogenase